MLHSEIWKTEILLREVMGLPLFILSYENLSKSGLGRNTRVVS